MTVVVCDTCGANYPVRSDFEIDGPCAECGEPTLRAEDAYDADPHQLTCTNCGREVDGGRSTSAEARDDDYGAGRYSVDDPCPLCGGELVPSDDAPSPRDRAEFKLARSVASKVRAEAGRDTLPVDVWAIAEAAGFRVVHGDGEQGLLRDRVIEISASEAVVAQRWSVAHELGHGLLRHEVPSTKIEQEANAFASELLIPRKELRRLVGEGMGYRRLAATFQVSREALGWALRQANLTAKVAGP